MKIGGMFSAGAEARYGLPLGPEYTYETMLRKKDDSIKFFVY